MHIGKYIDMILYEKKMTRRLLADMISMNYGELEEKFKKILFQQLSC